MPKIASVLKEEVTRLARKELRTETEGLKKASTHYRSEIAALKRRLAELERTVAKLAKRNGNAIPVREAESEKQVRYSAGGFKKLRERLDLSAAEMGKLLGVSPQTVYNWEAEATRPSAQQIQLIAELCKLGKRAVAEKVAQS